MRDAASVRQLVLSKAQNETIITITEEHCHHNNNEKYINRLSNACKGIDYLVCVSKELTNFYKKEIPHTKPVYIPNGLDYTPTKLSKLNNKNLEHLKEIGNVKEELGKIIREKEDTINLLQNTLFNIIV